MRNLIWLILLLLGCANPLKPERVYDVIDYTILQNGLLTTRRLLV